MEGEMWTNLQAMLRDKENNEPQASDGREYPQQSHRGHSMRDSRYTKKRIPRWHHRLHEEKAKLNRNGRVEFLAKMPSNVSFHEQSIHVRLQ